MLARFVTYVQSVFEFPWDSIWWCSCLILVISWQTGGLLFGDKGRQTWCTAVMTDWSFNKNMGLGFRPVCVVVVFAATHTALHLSYRRQTVIHEHKFTNRKPTLIHSLSLTLLSSRAHSNTSSRVEEPEPREYDTQRDLYISETLNSNTSHLPERHFTTNRMA